jgi:uncharacterized protein YceK
MKRLLLLLVALNCVPLGTGCQSVSQHAKSPFLYTVSSTVYLGCYPGVRANWDLMTVVCDSEYMKEPLAVGNWFTCGPAFFDMPFSFVLDTVLLPVDLGR